MIDLSAIWQFELRGGNSPNPREGACLLDAVSWLEYGHLGDRPPCVCPVITAYGRAINDAMSHAGRQRLKVFIPRLVGTVDPSAEYPRATYLAWQAIRVFAPTALEAAGLTKAANRLRFFDGSLGEAAVAARFLSRTIRGSASVPVWAAVRAADAAWVVGAAARAAGAAGAVKAAKGAARATRAAGAVKAARAAGVAARGAGVAAKTASDDLMIAALDGVLQIGRQSSEVALEQLHAANRTFAEARA